jgi:glycosyltransferase involved in cell wall biosynthesis
MIATIVINGEKQENLIKRSINSCLKQTYKKKQIVVVYNNLRNIKFIKNIYKKKKVLFVKINKKIQNATKDQLYKIKKALPYIKGQYVFLLDGDDYFLKNKVLKVMKKLINKKLLIQDNYYELINNKKKITKQQHYKEYIFYKYFFNNWPRRISTSSQALPTEVLKEFFKYKNPFKWKSLAIDAQLAIFCKYKFSVMNLNNAYTVKNILQYSVDKKYQNMLNKDFWLRRIEQHKLNNSYEKKNFKGMDFLICRIINIFIK